MSALLAAAALTALFAQPADPPAAAAAETFQLDIAERRIDREGFQASTALRMESEGGGIALIVGAAVSARSIDVVLRDVKGTVRFRADARRLDALRTLAPDPDQH